MHSSAHRPVGRAFGGSATAIGARAVVARLHARRRPTGAEGAQLG